jgi:DNA-binding IclR family transcriptional regulator
MPKATVPAVERSILILDALAVAAEPLTLAALTSATRLPKSSVLGICTTLVHGGLVQRTSEGSYRLGLRIVDLAHAYLAQSDITAEFVNAWESLALLPEETVVLSVLDGTDVVYVACRNGQNGLSFSYRIGMRLPATCTASGKALLSTIAPDAVASLYATHPLERLTPQSRRDVAELQRDLAEARSLGYAIDDEETREGMSCIGAPVFDSPRGTAVAAVAISMLKAEFATPKRDRAVETLRTFADVLSRRLGGAIAGKV